jgi:hypothetical protein
VRLSRARIALRVALLAVGGAYLLWRGVMAQRALAGLEGGEALFGSRLALVGILMGALALLTAASGALTLRRKPPRRTLQLGDLTSENAVRAPERGSPERASVPQGNRGRT